MSVKKEESTGNTLCDCMTCYKSLSSSSGHTNVLEETRSEK